MAAARGAGGRLVGIGFMIALAVAVGLSSLTIGAMLSTTLSHRSGCNRPPAHQPVGGCFGGCCRYRCWRNMARTLLAYDSYYWGADHAGFPVSSFIVLVTFAAYLVSGAAPVRARTGHRRGPRAVVSVAER